MATPAAASAWGSGTRCGRYHVLGLVVALADPGVEQHQAVSWRTR